jgi:hypothetical protein
MLRGVGNGCAPKLGPASLPALPEIDEEATEHANEVLGVSRMLLEEVEEQIEPSEADCHDIVAVAVAAIQTIDGPA